MPARRALAAGSFVERASFLCPQRLRTALRRRPRPEATRGLVASEPGNTDRRRGDETAESAGGHRANRRCAPVPGGRRVAGTGGSAKRAACAPKENRGASRIGLAPCHRGLGAVIHSEEPGCAAGNPAVTSERAEKTGEVAAKEGSPASSTADRAAQELKQQLTRKQWRNRQKNRRRQKNKFKASTSSVAGDPPDDQGGQTPDTEAPDRQTTSLRQHLESRLDAARFRYINQLLYTRSSREAAQLFQEDPEALAVYHRGFALQAARWPERPVERFVRYLHRRPASLVVADFGCGDCTLARSLPNRVHCFDLAALDPRVTVCDMAQVPLEDASVDVAVFCLALMGTNLREILQEAHRVLRAGGTLLVAEVASRFADLRAFLGALAQLGFRLTSKDVSDSHFYTFELRKTDRAEAAKAAEEPRGLALQPCLYKRR